MNRKTNTSDVLFLSLESIVATRLNKLIVYTLVIKSVQRKRQSEKFMETWYEWLLSQECGIV